MNDKQKDIIIKTLKSQGFNEKQINEYMKKYEKGDISIDDLIDKFVARVDADPHSISNKNCESGKCEAWQIDKDGN